jgi:hypothetical protein
LRDFGRSRVDRAVVCIAERPVLSIMQYGQHHARALILMNPSIALSLPNIEARSEEIIAAEAAFPDADQSTFRDCYTRIICRLREGGPVLPEQLDDLLVRQSKCRQCPFRDCGKQFNRRDRARAHVRKHLNNRTFACDGECGDSNW